jgi:hypothetical protein
MINVCKLCGKNREIRQSHIIPSFVGKWMKDTSPTGYLRQGVNPNVRKQDIPKEYLLCNDCEGYFSTFEGEFAKKVFYPYIYQELDEWSVAQGKITTIDYDDWLLKFIISVQWRSLITDRSDDYDSTVKVYEQFGTKISEYIKIWCDYLQGLRSDSGESRHYVIFLQNLASGSGTLPEGLNKRINTYLCRAIDTTLAFSKSNLFLYTKMGPIVLLSALIPEELDKMKKYKVRMKGKLYTAQQLINQRVNQFIFIDRPNEVMGLVDNISKKQQSKINDDTQLGIKDMKGTNSVLIGYSDFMMGKGKRMR